MKGRTALKRTTKEEVYLILRSAGSYVSGESISSRLGISRAAIHNAVNALREEGFGISAATNRGYRLVKEPDAVTGTTLAAYLPAERLKTVVCLPVTTSTNAELAALAAQGAADGTCVFAETQTAGRGRIGRSFSSPPGKGIYFSYLIRPDAAKEQTEAVSWLQVTGWTAVAVSEAVRKVCGVTPQIKWVNDLLLGGRKLCGILTQTELETESACIRSMVVGIGVNVGQSVRDFPKELQGTATSVFRETGRLFPRAAIAAEMVRQMDSLRANWPGGKEEYLRTYRERSAVAGEEILILEGGRSSKARAVGINDDFGLIVEKEGGVREIITSGEISIRFQ